MYSFLIENKTKSTTSANIKVFLKTSIQRVLNTLIEKVVQIETIGRTMPLKGIRVLEFAGLAPGPFCGKILADFGAEVTVIDQVPHKEHDVLSRGKRTLALNLKKPLGQKLIRELAKSHDVILEPFRPGVMEKLNLGPEILCKENPHLIYARLTGFGQTGRLAPRAGHDINYAAMSGVLSMLGRQNEKPQTPINILADFAGGSLMCAFGICLAILERNRSGLGQIIDSAMMDGAAYVASWLFMSRSQEMLWGKKRGGNILDGGSFFYDVYETRDGKYMSVGPMEYQFFEKFKEAIGLPQLSQFAVDDAEQESFKALLKAVFLQKTQAEWSVIFEDIDACVYPVVEWNEVMQHDHIVARNNFQQLDGNLTPNPAPRLSRTPGKLCTRLNNSQEAVDQALDLVRKLNLTQDEFRQLVEDRVLTLPVDAKL